MTLVTVVATQITTPYFTVDEAVKYLRMEHLGHPSKQIMRWIKAGKLRCGGRPGAPLFTQQQLDAFVSIHGGKK